LRLLQALKLGLSVEIGITIVLLAIVPDRLTRAWAVKQPGHVERATWAQRHRLLAIWAGLVALGFVLAAIHPYFVEVERNQALSLADPVDAVVGGFITLIDPVTEWLRWFLITWVLIPRAKPSSGCRPRRCRWPGPVSAGGSGGRGRRGCAWPLPCRSRCRVGGTGR
jgi:glycine betaine/proline transport system permease protein